MRILLLCFCVLIGQVSAEIRLTDDLGRTVQLEAPAQGVISLVPHATELLYDINAQDQLIATVRYADYPEAAKAKPRVGDYNSLNSEAILMLEPDLIIAYPTGPARAQVDRLIELGIPVFFSDPQNFDAIAQAMRDLGQLTAQVDSANAAASDFEAAIAALQQRYANRSELSVFYEVWHEPIYTLNGDSYISDVIELCGGRNVFADLPVLSPQVSLEAVFAANPDVIVTDSPDLWRQWTQLQAVQTDALISTDADVLHRPTPSLLIGATQLCVDLQRIRTTIGAQ
ncbi:cobalamin-binding protein [Saccharospirillum sp. HFRX-1]|uniref:cobalamin-binding protein n=1 Tax=unclassified Saccharospirillum TaxID=2633430 RepID=UPI00370FF7F8